MKNIDLNTVDRDELVDIRDVKVNTALPKRERAIDFIRQIGNPYCYKHGKYVVKVGFSDTEVSLEERLAGYIAEALTLTGWNRRTAMQKLCRFRLQHHGKAYTIRFAAILLIRTQKLTALFGKT